MDTGKCGVCKYYKELPDMSVCVLKTLIENPVVSRDGTCGRFQYKFERPKGGKEKALGGQG